MDRILRFMDSRALRILAIGAMAVGVVHILIPGILYLIREGVF